MLDSKDIKKLATILATKDDIDDLKKDLSGLRESVQVLTISVDKLVKAVDDLTQEYSAISSNIDRHDKWIKIIANKVGVKLES